jgi:protein-disulfide isomerase
LCNRLAIKAYPTWFINGKRYEGVLSFDRLAELSAFPQ